MSHLRRYNNGPFHLTIYFGGKRLQRSLGTKKKSEADRIVSTVKETASFLERGVLSLPDRSSTDDL